MNKLPEAGAARRTQLLRSKGMLDLLHALTGRPEFSFAAYLRSHPEERALILQVFRPSWMTRIKRQMADKLYISKRPKG